MKEYRFLTPFMALVVAMGFMLGACTDNPVVHEDVMSVRTLNGLDVLTGDASSKTTLIAKLTPALGVGNFVSYDDAQLCYDIFTEEAVGEFDLRGFKVDSNDPFQNAHIETIISANKQDLKWIATDAEVLAVVMKGGPNYNLYDYFTPRYVRDPNTRYTGSEDYWLTSPSHQTDRFGNPRYPAISHYNFCYIPEVPEGEQGCTPGYWRNHADRWVGVAPADDFDATFGVDLFDPNITLGTAIWLGGGGNNALARHATAALLNAHAKALGSNGQFVDYPYTVAEVIQMVQDAVANDTIEATKNLFEAANELGCPLSGTPAVPVN